MSQTTKIQWCDSTVNPVMGCSGCELWNENQQTCYAGQLHQRWKSNPGFSPDFLNPKLFPGRMAEAAGWSDLTGKDRPDKPWLNGLPRLIFVSDMGDALSENGAIDHDDNPMPDGAVPFEFLKEEIIDTALSEHGQRHQWLWLTKRPARLRQFCGWLSEQHGIDLPENVWVGTSITTTASLSRIAHLAQVGNGETIRFLSAEPLWEEVSLSDHLNGISWVLCGGESRQGEPAREFKCEWARKLRDECEQTGIPYFVKQLGSNVTDGGVCLKLKDGHGGDWVEWPEDLRIRELPTTGRFGVEIVREVLTRSSTTNPTEPEPTDLGTLADQIRQECEQIVLAYRNGLVHARRAGELLLKAKKLCGHGTFENWVEANCPFAVRTAQEYMRIARKWKEIEEKAQNIALLTMAESLKLLAKPKERRGERQSSENVQESDSGEALDGNRQEEQDTPTIVSSQQEADQETETGNESEQAREENQIPSSSPPTVLPLIMGDIQTHHSCFQELEERAGIEPESVDLILTDIPYEKSFLPQVSDLAQFAERVLVDGGMLVTYYGHIAIPEVIQRMGATLKYRWMNASVWDGDESEVRFPKGKTVHSKWKPILIFTKGQFAQRGHWCDVTTVHRKEKEWHPHQQPLDEVKQLLNYFSKPDDLVVDPCGGGFTTAVACLELNRRCISCDCDPECVEKGKRRLAEALN